MRLGDLIEERVERCPDPQESGYERFIGLEHMDTGRLEVKRFGSTDDVTTSCKICHAGDMLFGRRNPYLRRAGVVNFDAACSGDIIVFRPKSECIIPDFIPIVLASKQFWTFAMKNQGGTMSKRVHFDDFADYIFELPDLDSQKKLSELIWSYERLIDCCDQQLLNLDLLIKSRFIEMFGDVLDIPVKLDDLSIRITKGTTPTTAGFEFTNEGVNFVKIENITENGQLLKESFMHVSQECHDTFKRSQLQKGDVLFSIAGAIGRTAVVDEDILPANTNQALAIIRLKDNVINTDYLIQCLHSEYVVKQYRSKKRGAAQLNLSLEDISNLKIPLPERSLQDKFAAFVHQVDKSKVNISSYKTYLESMKYSLINDQRLIP